ncbi:MAG TPA: phosphotransferase [Streptosporangiaceae bacterium]|nr:phosphotransferase [Streptosporangiaceae bacterium]
MAVCSQLAKQVQGPGDYLMEVCRLLWPAPAAATLSSRSQARRVRDGSASQLIVLPGTQAPKLVVPTGRAASAAAIRRYGEPGSAKAKLATRTLAGLLACGLGPVLGGRLTVTAPEGAPDIGSYLAELLGQPVRISMHIGAARANRKPVLQLLTPAGETVGFAKIGMTELTSALVAAERAALARLQAAALTKLQLPGVLAAGNWNGLDVLVLSPLPVWLRRVPLAADRLGRALAELSQVLGTSTAPLTASDYWRDLAGRLAQAGEGAEQSALRSSLDHLGELAGHSGPAELTFGCWHGDLTPWNLASTPAGLLVWDWERFAAGVPVGYDALHYWLQSQVVDVKRDPERAAAECADRAPELLGPFGVEPEAARVTALAYLADLSVRYLADRQAEAGARLGAPGTWLLPAMKSVISSWDRSR